jgi:CheY-like chemotaxis protein
MAPMRILIIEDDREAAAYLVKAFREAGHLPDHAGDGLEGYGMASEGSYDVLIVDRMLPKLDGLSLIGGLRDSTSSLAAITLPANLDTFQMDPKIIRVLNARDTVNGLPIRVVNSMTPEGLNTSVSRLGQVRTLIMGEGEGTMRIVDTPAADTPLKLVVRRYPLEEVTTSSDAFEIRDEQTEFLVYGMMQRAFLKDDPDTYDKGRSDRARDQFRAEAAAAKSASENANHVPQAVMYGGL